MRREGLRRILPSCPTCCVRNDNSTLFGGRLCVSEVPPCSAMLTLAGWRSSGVNLSIDLRDEATGERLAICCRRENREGLAFLSLSIRRTRTRPSSWRRLGDLSPMCRIREGPPALHLLVSSCLTLLLNPSINPAWSQTAGDALGPSPFDVLEPR